MHQSLAALRQFFRKQTVLCVSAVLALLSAAAVPPDADYLTYPDFRTLALLFCLMAIVAGFRSSASFFCWASPSSRGRAPCGSSP